jgi:hypothetical protein
LVETPGDLFHENIPLMCSTRQKKLAGIKSLDVYALALYVDERGAHSLLHSKVSGKSQQEVINDQSIYTGALQGEFLP